MRKALIIGILLALLTTSCSTRPSGVLSKGDMEEAMTNILLAQGIMERASQYKSRESRDSLAIAMLENLGITQAEFDSSVVWYARHGEIQKIGNRVEKRLKAMQDLLPAENINREEQQLLPYDGFTLPDRFYLSTATAQTLFAFQLDDSAKLAQYDIDNFAFGYSALGLGKSATLSTSVHFTYKDTTIVLNKELKGSQKTNRRMRITRPKFDQPLRSVAGYIRLSDSTEASSPVLIFGLSYSNGVRNSSSPKTPKTVPQTEEPQQRQVHREEQL